MKIRSAVCPSGMLLGEIVKNLSKMAVADSKQRLKMMVLSAVSYLTVLTLVELLVHPVSRVCAKLS